MIDHRDYDLTSHNTFGIAAHCRRYVEFGSIDELRELLLTLNDADEPLLVIGGGSNLLFLGDHRGTVLHSAIMGIEATEQGDDVLVRVGSGVCWDHLVAHCVEHGWHGMENLSLIPGEVGASAVQNIGAYGVEAKDIIHSVEAIGMDGSQMDLPCADCGYGYRWSRFKGEWAGRYIITHVTYRLSKHFQPRLDYGNIRAKLQADGIQTPTAQQLRQAIIDIRRAKLPDPEVVGNAGSFFKNPIVGRSYYELIARDYPSMPHYDADEGHVKLSAAWMIDQCGWRGRALGSAGVHSGQALVLVNRGGATGDDVLRLCNAIVADVEKTFGVTLHPEVVMVGGEQSLPTSQDEDSVGDGIMRLTFLGTGGSFGTPMIGCQCEVCRSADPKDTRLRTSALLETAHTRLLIDCGPDFRQQALAMPFRPIDGVLLTHSHYDHVGGIDDLRPFCKFGDIQIYADATTADHLRHSIPYCFDQHKYPGVPEIRMNVIAPHHPLRIGDIDIMPIEVMHGKMAILGFRFGPLAYITDMKTISSAAMAYLQGIHTLVVNALRFERPHHSHQLVDDAIAFARQVGARRTLLIHSCHHIGLHHKANAALPEGFEMAYDGQVVDIRYRSL